MIKKEEVNGIPDKVFQEYEIIRRNGACNMFDMNCVKYIAKQIGAKNLLPYCNSSSEYGKILMNYGEAVKLGIVKQDELVK